MEGLRWYVVDETSFNALRLTIGMKITVPWISATGACFFSKFVLLAKPV